MTGKEALKFIKENTRYRYVGWHSWDTEAIEKDLDKLTKYKRAFEILKEIFDIRFEKDEDGDCWIKIFPVTYDGCHVLGEPNNEQYELLEELMKGE